MNAFPKRRTRERSGIERAPRREFPEHLAFVRKHPCSIKGCPSRQIEAAHVRDSDLTPANEKGGTGMKPHDKWSLPLCGDHHGEQHAIGEPAFEKKHGINMGKIAQVFWWRSPPRRNYERRLEQEEA